ncbi:sodium:solute symporter [Allokutzneria oryzae]|uniref:Sodium:solute symporter n=1 Tax=Allokutzneria oryzae TaxID=1378989 RepID=A0ABV6A823_9PSEU
MRTLDIAVIAIFLVAMPVLGLLLSGKQRSSSDYFVGDRDLPWWAVCFSVVATETSSLTVISVPGVAYLGTFGFLQLAIGYLIGRIVVSFVLLPKYFSGELVTAYAFLGKRFGRGLQGTASVTFLVTRLLADGLRLALTALPVKVVLSSLGIDAAYWQILLCISVFTVIYTYLGGIKAVVWVDAIQMLVYVGGAVVVVAILAGRLPSDWFGQLVDAGKFDMFDLSLDPLTSPYAAITAIVGGAVLSMASHGSDQIIVQRLLTCRTLGDSRKALITSGVIVFFQFALFLLIGAMLWALYNGASLADRGLTKSDEIFPTFIVNELPPGLTGLLIAGILSAAMSTLASSLNSLSTSTVSDLYQRFTKRRLDDETVLRHGKIWTIVWAVIFVGFAIPFTTTTTPLVEQGLGITGYTYGALLGAFVLGLAVKRARQADAIAAFVVTVVVMGFVILGVEFTGANGKALPLAYPWYTVIGVAVTLIVGGLLSLRHRTDAPEAVETELPAK